MRYTEYKNWELSREKEKFGGKAQASGWYRQAVGDNGEEAALALPPTWWFNGTQGLLGVTAGFMIDANQPVSLSSPES